MVAGGQRKCSTRRARIAVLAGERHRRLVVECSACCKGEADESPWGDSYALSQTDDGFEWRADRPRQRTSVQSIWTLGTVASSEEAVSVGFPLHRALGPSFQTRDMN